MEQITLDNFIGGAVNYKIKPLIYSMSLTCYKFVCPYCKCDNTYEPPSNKCTECGKIFDADNVKEVKSKDYIECEKLGLSGAVRKNDKGKWEEVITDKVKR